MTNGQSKIAEDNIELLYSYWHKRGITDEDDRADLMEYYCRVIEKYDESKGKLSTILYISLDNYRTYLYNYRYKSVRYPKGGTTSLESATDDDKDYLYNFIEFDSDSFDSIEFLDVCEKVLATLVKQRKNRRKVNNAELFAMLCSGYSRTEIAERYKISAQAISVRVKEIKEVWKKEMEGC